MITIIIITITVMGRKAEELDDFLFCEWRKEKSKPNHKTTME